MYVPVFKGSNTEDNAAHCYGGEAEYNKAYRQSDTADNDAAYPHGGEVKDNATLLPWLRG
jgi:hypothetical protein